MKPFKDIEHLLFIHPKVPPADPNSGGVFTIILDGIPINIIAAWAGGWDHVSVTILDGNRCPTWAEMEFVKRLFFLPTETVMQLHVPGKDHVNVHSFCLHLWRPHFLPIPLPPKDYV